MNRHSHKTQKGTRIVYDINVNGEPKAQPRARAFAFKPKGGGKPMIRMYDPATAEGWKGILGAEAQKLIPDPLLGPVTMSISFYMPRPKSHYRTGKRSDELKDNAPGAHVGKPDLDNLEKAVMDAFTVAGVWRDDSQVYRKTAVKMYSEHPGAEITIEEMGRQI